MLIRILEQFYICKKALLLFEMKPFRFLFILQPTFAVFVLSLVVGCTKYEPNTDGEPYTPPEVVYPNYSFSRIDGNGLMMTKRNFSYYNDPFTGIIETTTKEASASFKSSPFDSFYSNAGSVSCQGKNLFLQSNQSYLLDKSAGTTLSYNDTLGTSWDVSSNGTSGIAAFAYTTNSPMPFYRGVSNHSIPITISKSIGVKISLGANIVGADSVFVSITSGAKTIQKTVWGLDLECEFTKTELLALPATSGETALLQIAAIKFDVSLQGGKKMYFANQSAYTKRVRVN